MITKEKVEKRKHVSQMSVQEKDFIWKRLKGVKETDWKVVDHALERIGEKGIRVTIKDLVTTIYNAELIEYKTIDKWNGVQERVVLRSKSVVNRNFNIHVVYNLTEKCIVTVWMNRIKDRHKTLDWSIYDAELKVLGV